MATLGGEEIGKTVIVGCCPDQRVNVQMDPLNGSSNIDVAVSIGSIFGIWKRDTSDPVTHARLLRSGNEQAAAVYVSYGSSTNERNYSAMDAHTRKAIEMLRESFSLRYIDSLVEDLHRNLLKGGIFLYHADAKNNQGKLRLMYEANPLVYVAEKAGGAASSGKMRILDTQPEKLHQRISPIIGNSDVVESTIDMRNSSIRIH